MSSRFFKEATGAIASKLGGLVIRFGSGIILARMLSPEGRGAYALLQVYPMLANSLAELGIRQATVRLIGTKAAPDNEIIGNIVSLWLITSLLGGAAIAIIYERLNNPLLSTLAILLAAGLVPLGVAASYARGVFLGKEQIQTFNRFVWGAEAAYLAMLVGAWSLKQVTVDAAITALLLSNVIIAALSLHAVSRIGPLRFRFNASLLKTILAMGAMYASTSFVLQCLYKVQSILVERLSGNTELGYFALAGSLAEQLWQLPTTLGQVIFSRSANSTDPAAFSAKTAQLHRILLPAAAGAGAVFALALFPIIPFIYGGAFRPSSPVAAILLIGVVAFCSFRILMMDLAGKGRQMITLSMVLPGLACNVGLGLYLIPRHGAIGAAIAASAAYSVSALAMIVVYSSICRIPFRDLLLVRREDIGVVWNLIRRRRSSTPAPVSAVP